VMTNHGAVFSHRDRVLSIESVGIDNPSLEV
jgi:hypothetical protein